MKLGDLFGTEEIAQIPKEASKQVELTPDQKQPLPPGELPKDKARVCQFFLLKFNTEKIVTKAEEV